MTIRRDVPKDWHIWAFENGATIDLPGIYEWKIEGAGSYIGRYSNRSRLLGEYPFNVFRLRDGLPYRPKKPLGFRLIHHELLSAHRENRRIELIILENCEKSRLNERERYYTTERGSINWRTSVARGAKRLSTDISAPQTDVGTPG